jgi:hypothetical protein
MMNLPFDSAARPQKYAVFMVYLGVFAINLSIPYCQDYAALHKI